jgi:hypothetical protein
MAHLSERVWNLCDRQDSESTTPTRFRRLLMFWAEKKEEDVAAPSSRAMPDGPTTTEQSNVTVDVQLPEKSEHEALEFIDEPELTEEPDGYGHGV